MKNKILKLWYKLIGKTPLDFEMVSYWKTKEYVEGKITTDKDGSTLMYLDGEKYPIRMFPRGHLICNEPGKFAPMSVLKHRIKNEVFNESWAKLEAGVKDEVIIQDIKDKLFGVIAEQAKESKYDMVPPEKMCPAVREIYRGFTVVAKGDQRILNLRDYLTFILQEDDAYRYRVQWLVNYFRPRWFMSSKMLIKAFIWALDRCSHAEVVGDMKDKIKLLKRVLSLCLKDENISRLFTEFACEVNWKKVELGKGEKFHFRAKYFKVDYPVLEY